MKIKEDQFQMSNELATYIINYLKENKTSFKNFCKKHNLSYYLTYKVIDRKIKMHIGYSYLAKLSRLVGFTAPNTYIKKYPK